MAEYPFIIEIWLLVKWKCLSCNQR